MPNNSIESRWKISYLLNGTIVLLSFIFAIVLNNLNIIGIGLSLAGLIEGFITIKRKEFFVDFPFGKIQGSVAILIGLIITAISTVYMIFSIIEIL